MLVVGGSVLPWGRSGERDRSGFDLARLARRLDVLDGAVAGAARAWVLAPLVLAGVLVATGAGLRWLAVLLAGVLAATGSFLVLAVHRSPLTPRWGLSVTLAGVVAVVLGAVVGSVRSAGR